MEHLLERFLNALHEFHGTDTWWCGHKLNICFLINHLTGQCAIWAVDTIMFVPLLRDIPRNIVNENNDQDCIYWPSPSKGSQRMWHASCKTHRLIYIGEYCKIRGLWLEPWMLTCKFVSALQCIEIFKILTKVVETLFHCSIVNNQACLKLLYISWN